MKQRLITLDFESYFDTKFSLRKLPTLLYIRSPEFKAHGCAIKEGEGDSYWVTGTDLQKAFDDLDLESATVISHNANFDMAVLADRYTHMANRYVDTLGLCRALLPRDISFDLGTVALLLGVGEKGAELESSKGVRDLSPELEEAIAGYSCNDADLTFGIYTLLWGALPEGERETMDLVIRMSNVGIFRWDQTQADPAKQEIVEDRERKLKIVGVTPEQLRSRDKFAALLRARGVEPPTKISAKTGKETYAFSKQDPDFILLAGNPDVADLVEAKKSWASNNAITRIDNLSQICALAPETLPVQLGYNGAHTGRLSGGGKINMQNLNARGLGSGLRKAIIAPPGHVIVVYDLAGIELRMNMWFSGQLDVLDKIRNGADIYKEEAGRQFDIPADEVDKTQRQFGKIIQLGCFAGDTLVLTKRGLQPLHSITKVDMVWDGVEWVRHDGLIDQGYKEVIDLCGTKVTPDHLVLCGTQWKDALSLAQDESILYQALVTGSESLPSQDTNPTTSGSLLALKTPATNAQSVISKRVSTSWKRVYDLANAGPRNRFTIWTSAGPLIVHNCGYQMGAKRFRAFCAIGPMGMDPMYLSDDKAHLTIQKYRTGVPKVKASWDWLNNVAIQTMWQKGQSVDRGPVTIEHDAVTLPNGLQLQYPNLHPTEDGWVWGLNGHIHFLHGGLLQENIVQALSGVVVKEMMNEIDAELDGLAFTRQMLRGDAPVRRFGFFAEPAGTGAVVHQVHDEILVVCREQDADDVSALIEKIMTKPRSWAPDLPLAVEGGYDDCYSK